jgi:hypothetical protein
MRPEIVSYFSFINNLIIGAVVFDPPHEKVEDIQPGHGGTLIAPHDNDSLRSPFAGVAIAPGAASGAIPA